jgi:23S rRNA (guanosine2251-2'-O)-methyltransferase
MQIEGKNAVLEALRAGMRVERVLLAEGLKPDATLRELKRHLKTQDITAECVHRRELDRISERGAHQGVIAQFAPFSFVPLSELIVHATTQTSSAPSPALIMVLDHLTDPGNLGAIARSAEVIGAAGLVVAKDRAAAFTPAAHKAAAGAFAHLAVAQVTNITRTLEQLQKSGFWIAGASEHAEQLAWDAPLSGNIALVLGSEGEGLSRLVQQRCDFLVRLPQSGKVQSLNVAQAGTALMYEWLRQNAANAVSLCRDT